MRMCCTTRPITDLAPQHQVHIEDISIYSTLNREYSSCALSTLVDKVGKTIIQNVHKRCSWEY